MAALTINSLSKNGNSATGLLLSGAAASAGGDTISNQDGKALLWVNNGGGSPITLTVTVQNASQFTASGSPVTATSIAYTITNGTSRMLGPWDPSIYNDGNQNIAITYSAVTSVTVLAIKSSV